MEKILSDQLEEKLNDSEFVILEFSSPGCASCHRVPPLLDDVFSELPDVDVKAYEINIAESPQAANKYDVLGIPTLIIFHKGEELKRFAFVPKKKKILDVLT